MAKQLSLKYVIFEEDALNIINGKQETIRQYQLVHLISLLEFHFCFNISHLFFFSFFFKRESSSLLKWNLKPKEGDSLGARN